MTFRKFTGAFFPGFSLIEVAIVLIIIGLVGGMAMPLLKSTMEWQKTTTTAQNQEKILYALASYAVHHQRLPCASDPVSQQGKQSPLRRRGILPYADLGLPESVAKDGYGRWFTYVVDEYFTMSPEMPIGPQKQVNQLCQKKMYDNRRQTKSLAIKETRNDVAFALISHGLRGGGAYPNPLAIPAQGEDEHQNATSETEIVDRPVSHHPSHPFSHKVVWMTGPNLLAVYAHTQCPSNDFQPQGRNQFYQPQDPGGQAARYQQPVNPGAGRNIGGNGK